jgi:hypothetical protein
MRFFGNFLGIIFWRFNCHLQLKRHTHACHHHQSHHHRFPQPSLTNDRSIDRSNPTATKQHIIRLPSSSRLRSDSSAFDARLFSAPPAIKETTAATDVKLLSRSICCH